MSPPEARYQPRDQQTGGDPEADPEVAQPPAGRAARPLQHRLGVPQKGRHVVAEELSHGGQARPARTSDEQRCANLLFQLTNLLCQRRLTQMERPSGAPKVALLGQGLKRPKEASFHAHSNK
jgi:hypothetical protein